MTGGIRVDALEQLLHLLLRGDTRVGTGAGIEDGVGGNLGLLSLELIVVDDGLIGLHAVLAVVLDTLRNVESVVEVADLLDKGLHELVLGLTLEMQDVLGDEGVAALGALVLSR